MKSIFYILVLLICFGHVFSQEIVPNGYNIFYYDNGVVSSEGTMADGKPEGYWKTYSKNGKIKSEGNRKNFQLDSLWKFYNEEGILTTEFTYKNGKKTGPKNNYNVKSKKLESKEYYENDLKHGFTYYYYGKDSVSKKVPFDKGREQGTGYEYDRDGIIINIIVYKNGFIAHQDKINRKDVQGRKQGIWKEFYPDMVVKNEVKYDAGLMNGYYKTYNEKGELLKTIKYINGEEQKEAVELSKLDVEYDYYDNAQPKVVTTSRNGVKEGVERYFSETGQVINAKTYKNGELVSEGINDAEGKMQGKWKEYYPDGKLRGEGEYKDSKKVGEWIYYHPNGEIEQKGKYTSSSKPTGTWRWYHDNKQLRREETYEKGKEEGEYKEYDEKGNPLIIGQYIEGQEDGKWFYDYGDYTEEGTYKNGTKDGTWKGYYKTNGKLAFEGKFIDGNENGKHVYYYDSGFIRIEGEYVMSKKEGHWKYYSEAGLLIVTEYYEEDELQKVDGVKINKDVPLDTTKP